MVKIFLLFVEKLANSSLLPAFPATSRKFLSHFSFAPALYKGLMAFFSAKHSPIKKPLRVEAAFIIHFQQAIYSEEVRSTP